MQANNHETRSVFMVLRQSPAEIVNYAVTIDYKR